MYNNHTRAGLALLAALGAQVASAQTCTYPIAATLSGYNAQFNGSIAAATSTRLNFGISCSGQSALYSNTYTALIALDLPATGSPVSIDTCGSEVDTLIAGESWAQHAWHWVDERHRGWRTIAQTQ